jgi:23S rRNA maturation-related 3'-5' exoribonuclease YhaM
MAQHALIKWTNYRNNDDLYDVKLLKDLIKGTEPNHKLNKEYRIKESDGHYYTARLLKIGNFI